MSERKIETSDSIQVTSCTFRAKHITYTETRDNYLSNTYYHTKYPKCIVN